MCRKANKIPSRRTSYFSLIEMIAAVGILLMVGMSIGVSLSGFYRAWNQTRRAGDYLQQNLAIDRIMDNYFRNAIHFTWSNDSYDTNTTSIVFRGETGEIYLTSLGRSYQGEIGGLIFVHLFLEEDKLICEYAPVPILPWTEGEDVKTSRETVAAGIKEVVFKYAGKDENNELIWYDEYLEEDYEVIPLAIQMTIEFENGRRECWLRRSAGNSGWTNFGQQ